MPDLFTAAGVPEPRHPAIAPGAVLLRGFALPLDGILGALSDIIAQAPFRHITTPWGAASVAMTNSGHARWLSNRAGYRYDRIDPETGHPWPSMPECASTRDAALR